MLPLLPPPLLLLLLIVAPSSAPPPRPARREVLVFHWDAAGGYPGGRRDPDRGDLLYVNNTPAAWRSYDWTLVTTVVTFTFGGTIDPELLATAHRHGARVVVGAAAQNSALWAGPRALNSSSHRTALAADVVANVLKQGADGVNLDIEWPSLALREGLTAFVCELAAVLRKARPAAHVSFDLPARPVLYEPGTDAYDFPALAACLDNVVVMDYDMATPDQLKANLSAPNSPLDGVRAGLAGYVGLGVPAAQLVLAMPWVGMVYPCLGLDPAREGPSGCIPWPPWILDPDNCTIETGFGTIVSTLLPKAVHGRQWDATSSSPWFDYLDESVAPPKRHRVWYDDHESCAAKTALSTELGLAGVGVWIGNALGPYATGLVGEALWASLRTAPPPAPAPVPHKQPVFHPPQLVSDSPFNDYADGYYMLPRTGSGDNDNGGNVGGGDGVVFGVGAGRFTQSSDGGHSWTALPQWDGNDSDPAGYNPAVPFFGPKFGLLTPAGTLRDWGHINWVPKANTSYSSFSAQSGVEFFINGSGWVAHRRPATPVNITFGNLPHPVQCPSWYWPHSCPFWIGSGSGGDVVVLEDNVTAIQTAVVTYLHGHTLNKPEACGVFVFKSTDTPHYGKWDYLSTVATAAQFPGAGEGPNENAIALLADGQTLTVVFRLDNGDGDPLHPAAAKQSPYQQSFSTSNGATWSVPKPMAATSGLPMGESRPRLKMLTSAGPLLLIGGRDVVSGRGDAILWVNYAADGIAWQDHSLSGRHNALLPARRQSWAFSPMVNLSDYRATNGYSAIVQVGPRSVLVTYNRGPKNGAAAHRGPFAMNATCQAAVDRLCNGSGYAVYPELTALVATVKAEGGKLPLVGRHTRGSASLPNGGGSPAWRCYSPSALDPATGEYSVARNSTLYLSDTAMIGAVEEALFRCDGCNQYGVCARPASLGVWSSGLEQLGGPAATVHDEEWARPLVFSMRMDFPL